jgi:hypothetical protein
MAASASSHSAKIEGVPVRNSLLVVVLAALIGLVCTAAAPAATGPGNQQAGIVAALNATFPDVRSKVTYQGIKITSVPDKVWAIAYVNPKPAYQATIQSFYAVLIKIPNRQSKYYWVVADFGNAYVGCGVASLQVVRDLTGTRNPCPPGAFES